MGLQELGRHSALEQLRIGLMRLLFELPVSSMSLHMTRRPVNRTALQSPSARAVSKVEVERCMVQDAEKQIEGLDIFTFAFLSLHVSTQKHISII